MCGRVNEVGACAKAMHGPPVVSDYPRNVLISANSNTTEFRDMKIIPFLESHFLKLCKLPLLVIAVYVNTRQVF